jgi:hypothetical protein
MAVIDLEKPRQRHVRANTGTNFPRCRNVWFVVAGMAYRTVVPAVLPVAEETT